jgi:N-carbamoyl-L-amino-acid hydrolase
VSHLTINQDRLLADLAALAAIGQTPQGGVSRPAMSPNDVAGRAWLRARVEEAGLDFSQDGAGNLSARLPAADPAAPTVLAGSHLDTVPNGGRFDGALGVLAALEVLRTVQEAGLELPVHLEAISFTDEEGSVLAMLGSRALAGQLTGQHLVHPRSDIEDLRVGLHRLGLAPAGLLAANRDPATLLAFVELHIEQGTRLEEAHSDIGVVTSIVGIRSYWLRFTGEAAHAGTTPMPQRADALWGATDFLHRARALVMEDYTPGVVNCGQLRVQPGAFNIVPGQVDLALEFRHGSEDQLDAMEAALMVVAESAARGHGLELAVESTARVAPAPMSERVMAAVERAAGLLGLRHQRLMSFAGHDTQNLARSVPSGLIFVPSVGGISHNPQENTHPQDLVNGANTLLHTVLALALSPLSP